MSPLSQAEDCFRRILRLRMLEAGYLPCFRLQIRSADLCWNWRSTSAVVSLIIRIKKRMQKMKVSTRQEWHCSQDQNSLQSSSWTTQLGRVSICIFKINGSDNRLYLSATGLLSHVDLLIDADSQDAIDLACEEALAIVRQAIASRLIELRKESESLEIALAAYHGHK